MKPIRVVLLVLGSLIALLGFGLVAGGAGLGWALATQRDDAGFFATSTERLETDSYALTSDRIDLGDPGPDDWSDQELATVRVRADAAGERELFVGIGPEADVEAFLADVPHDEIVDIGEGSGDIEYRSENAQGRSRPDPPADQAFWVAQANGVGTQTVTWDIEPGEWAIVVMHADGSRPVAADVELGARIDVLGPIAVGLGIGGALLLVIGAGLIVGGVVQPHAAPAPPPVGGPAPAPVSGRAGDEVASPLRIEGHLDPGLSRWQWLVKWFLAIPHFVVLVFLWIAFAVLTLVAFLAILFTGRYPRSIFEFNVGVLRWSWRVSFYATSALGTDRYPPFTIHGADYPASLDVAYPDSLSRGLVLVKSWLLALPHLVIVSLLTAAWAAGGDGDDGQFLFQGGLLGVLVFVAGVALLVTGRYPGGLFDLIMGINRWVYRVIVYVALMTDRYPPFHLDQGPTEPGAAPRPDPPVPPGVEPVPLPGPDPGGVPGSPTG